MLDIDQVKMHLRVDQDAEDDLIESIMETARLSVAEYLGLPEAQMTSTVPRPIKSAALLLIGDLYANRESQTDRPLHNNTAYERLLQPYRVMAA